LAGFEVSTEALKVPRVGPTPFVVGRGVGRAAGKAASFVVRNAERIPGILNRLGF